MHEKKDDTCLLWTYAGIFFGWWCYDENNNAKINRIYKDYCVRNNIDTNVKQCNSLSTIPKIISKKKLSVFDPVNFDCITSSSIDDNCNDDNHNDSINYDIKINQDIFRIDFDNMKQFDIFNSKKQRNIKPLYVPRKIYDNKPALMNYLKACDVRGIAGKSFD